jgi:hypothetical protein
MKCFYCTALTNAIRMEEVFYSTYYRNCDSSGFDPGRGKTSFYRPGVS